MENEIDSLLKELVKQKKDEEKEKVLTTGVNTIPDMQEELISMRNVHPADHW